LAPDAIIRVQSWRALDGVAAKLDALPVSRSAWPGAFRCFWMAAFDVSVDVLNALALGAGVVLEELAFTEPDAAIVRFLQPADRERAVTESPCSQSQVHCRHKTARGLENELGTKHADPRRGSRFRVFHEAPQASAVSCLDRAISAPSRECVSRCLN
jgi:hypothetical protein